jgi:hypothetical protein
MAFQLAALMVQGDHSTAPREVFAQLGFPNGLSAGTVPFIEATSPQQYSRMLGSTGSWTMITDAMPFVSYSSTAPVGSLWSGEVTKFLRESSQGGKTSFGFIMSKLSRNYGFSLHVDGEHKRSLLTQMGNVLVDVGATIDAEHTVAKIEDRELALFRMMEELGVPYHDFENVRFNFFAFERDD